jgi:hypothetical protein
VGAAMLCGVAGTEQATVANSVAYLKSWISRLNADSRLVVQAASAAQKAANYIRGKSPKDPCGCGRAPCKLNLLSLSLSEKYGPTRIAELMRLQVELMAL